MANINFNWLTGGMAIIDFSNKEEVESYLKDNINKISSFCVNNCNVVSGKELKKNISEDNYNKEISDWDIEDYIDLHLQSLKTLKDNCYFIVGDYKTNDAKLYSVYYKSHIKALVHDFLMETGILKWY